MRVTQPALRGPAMYASRQTARGSPHKLGLSVPARVSCLHGGEGEGRKPHHRLPTAQRTYYVLQTGIAGAVVLHSMSIVQQEV